MADSSKVKWAPRARERIRGLDRSNREALREASAEFLKSGRTPLDGPALSQNEALRWWIVTDQIVVEYEVFSEGEHPELPNGGFFVTVIVTEAGAIERIKQHLARS